MKKLKTEIVSNGKEYWRKNVNTSFLTFLACKYAGINQISEIHMGEREYNKFIFEFLLVEGNVYNPCTNKFPKNQKDYFRTLWKYTYDEDRDFLWTINVKRKGYYKLPTNYIDDVKDSSLKIQRLSLSFVSIWLYRDKHWDKNTNLLTIQNEFISKFSITEEELEHLFDVDIIDESLLVNDIDSMQEEKLLSELSIIDLASDINEPDKSRRIEFINYRILRDTLLSRRIKIIHDFECQLCGLTLNLLNAKKYSEIHHIKPLGNPHNGPDIKENMICVCPNHHVLLDFGAIFLERSMLKNNTDHSISDEYIDYHNTKIYKK